MAFAANPPTETVSLPLLFLLLALSPDDQSEPKASAAPPKGGLIQLPELINGGTPDYPEALIGSGKNGKCILLVDIDDAGLVQEINVQKCDDPAFAEAAFAVMPHYTFIPGATATGTVPVRITWQADFQHPVEAKPEPEKPKPVRISGKVREGGTGVVLAAADVTCVGQDVYARADERGRFELRGVADGDCVLQASAPGYFARKKTIKLKPNEAVELTLYLSPKASNAMRTVVRGRKEETHMTRRILEAEELGRVPGTFGDPIRAIERLPGVARTPFLGGGGGLVVRGAEPQDSGYYLDGVPIPALFHLGGGPSVIHPDFVGQLDFLPGGFGAHYGRSIAGIVEVRSRASKGDRFSGKIDVDLLDSGFRLEGPVAGRKDLSFGLSGRRSYVDVLLPLVTSVAGGPDASIQPIYWDYQARLDYKKGTTRAGLRFYGFDDVLVLAASDDDSAARAGEPPGLGIHGGVHRMVLDGRMKLDKKTELKGSLMLGHQFTGGEFGEDIYWNAGINELGIRSDLTYKLSKEHHFITGIDIGFQDLGLETQLPTVAGFERVFPGGAFTEDLGVLKLDENDRGSGYGVHATLRSKLFDRLTLLPGVRLDAYVWDGQDRLSVEPRLQARLMLAPKDRHLLKISGGKYSKLPEPAELSDSFGNPELELKGTWQYGLGYEYRPDPFFHVDLTAFYKKMFNLVEQNPDFVSGGSAPGLINNGDGRAYGLEVMLRHRPSPRPVYGWIAYTLSRSERYDRGDRDPEWTLFSLDQTHILSSVVGYKWGKGWSLGTTVRWVTGNPTTPRLGARFDIDSRFYRPLRGDRRTDRLPDYFQMDLRLEKKSSAKRNSFIWFVDVLNLTNRQNIEFYIYQYDQRAYSGIAGVPFFPSFGIEWSW